MRWSSYIGASLVVLELARGPTIAASAEQDAPPSVDVPSGTATLAQSQPGQASGTAPAAPGTGAARPTPAQPAPRPNAPRATPAAPGRTGPTTAPAAPASPASPPSTTQPGTAPAPAGSPTAAESARAELNRRLEAEFDSPTLLTQPGTFGTLAGFASGGIPQMIGDLGPLATKVTLPAPFPPPSPPGVSARRHVAALAPSVRALKFSEDQSPRPQDRIYYTFNYFQGVNDQVNQRLQAPIGYTQVFRDILGLEKTFFEGNGSLGIRLPIDSITAMSSLPPQDGNAGGSHSAVGDISIFGKYILLQNRDTGSLLSACIAIAPPTGPGRFAGFNSLSGITQTTTIQPCLGYIINRDRVYLQGFSILDVPMNSANAILMYNDFGIGYFLRRPEPNSMTNPMISLVAPTCEVHVNTPLNHRDVFNVRDAAGTQDIVNLTYGLNVGIYDRTLLTFAITNPVSSPKPLDFEAMFFLNFFFGRSLIRPTTTPPVL